MKKLTHHMGVLCILAGVLGGGIGYYGWNLIGAFLVGLACVLVTFFEEEYDPFDRYRKAFFQTTIDAEWWGCKYKDGCTVLIVDETAHCYGLRFPIAWKMNYTYPTWVRKDRVALID
jgi:hypothetical protein